MDSIKKTMLTLAAAATVANLFAVDYVVEGRIEGADGKMLYMSDYDRDETIDSALVVNGMFRFKGSFDRNAYVRIESGNQYANCVLDSLAVIDFNTHGPIAGTSLTCDFIKLLDKAKLIEDELQRFGEELRSHGFKQPEFGEIYKHLYDKRRPEMLALYTKAIAEHPDGVGEKALMSVAAGIQLSPDEWDTIYAQMPEATKNLQTAREFDQMFRQIRKTMPGKPFVDFKAKTVEGKEVLLSDYVGKGKYVVLDFWASWCRPCREEAESTIRPLYEKYKDDERFMILGVATWDQNDRTLAALKQLQYPWPQIVDADKVPMELYGFKWIPMIMLISPDGTILKRDLRGQQLVETVDEVLRNQD